MLSVSDMKEAHGELHDTFLTAFAGRVLFINSTALRGPLRASIGRCKALVELNLGRNQLTGPIPGELAQCTGLRQIKLHHNRLSGLLPDVFGSWVGLEVCFLQHNEFSGRLPASIGQCVSLSSLFLDNNKLSGALPVEALRNCVELEHLYLGANPDLSITLAAKEQLLANLPKCIKHTWPDSDTTSLNA